MFDVHRRLRKKFSIHACARFLNVSRALSQPFFMDRRSLYPEFFYNAV